jgi:hypothetical protein
MNITTDAKQTIYLEDIPVGRLVYEGQEHVFYVPCDGGFSQRLLPLIYNLAEPDRFSTSGATWLQGEFQPCKSKTRNNKYHTFSGRFMACLHNRKAYG